MNRILEKLGYSKFTRPDGYVRHDFKWYGFGRDNRCFVDSFISVPGRAYWLNSYRSAPVYIRLVQTCGWFAERRSKALLKLRWSGSMEKPYAHWKLCLLDRFYVGGDTPKWIQRKLKQRDLRRYEAMVGPEDDGTWMDPAGGWHDADEDNPAKMYE